MAQAPGTPTKDMKECYPGTPIVGSPGREKKASEVGASDTKITEVKLCDVSLIAFSTNNKRISVKGTVEKTATLGRMTGTPGKIVEFFSVNMVDDEIPPNKVRVSAFAENSKWCSMFTAGSKVLVECPLVAPNTKNQKPGQFHDRAVINYELRLMPYTKVTVEHDNTYVHIWPSIEDLVSQKVADGKSVSVAGIATVISDLITIGSEDGKGMPSHDRELLLSSPSGTTIKVLLHGQTAKNISCEEEGTEVCFGPMKVVWNERAKNAYVQSIPFESRRCDREGKTYVVPKKEDIKEDVAKTAEKPAAKTAEEPGAKPAEEPAAKKSGVVEETVDLSTDNVEDKELASAKKHDIEDVENAEKKPAVTKEDSNTVAVKIEPEEKKRGGRKNKKDILMQYE